MKKAPIYPFPAIVGQEKMKLALILNIINPGLSAYSSAAKKALPSPRLYEPLPIFCRKSRSFENDPFQLNPEKEQEEFRSIRTALGAGEQGQEVLPAITHKKVQVVELPVGATEDRVVGTLDLEYALKKGEKRVEPGILAKAHRNILYVGRG